MIKVNLVPDNLRKKKSKLKGFMIMPLEVIVGVAFALVAVLMLIHVSLFVVNFRMVSGHKGLQAKWQQLGPKKGEAETVLRQIKSMQDEIEALNEITGYDDPLWSQQLNIMSDQLPRGVWLNKLVYSDTLFFISGSSITRDAGDMMNVHGFIANLKKNKNFTSQSKDMELGSIQRRQVGKVEVSDFTIKVEKP